MLRNEASYVAHLQGIPEDKKRQYLGLGQLPLGIDSISATEWSKASQDGRWNLLREHAPYYRCLMDTPEGREAIVRDLTERRAFEDGVEAEIEQKRRWRELYNLGESDNSLARAEFVVRYEATDEEERQAYNVWADRWETVITESATTERGILPWNDLLTKLWTGDYGDISEVDANLERMTEQELDVFLGWVASRDSYMESFHSGWASQGEDEWVAQRQNERQAEAYNCLSEIDKKYYREWLFKNISSVEPSRVWQESDKERLIENLSNIEPFRTWGDMFATMTLGDVQQRNEIEESLQQMAPQDREAYTQWVRIVHSVWQEKHEAFFALWALPWHDGWKGKQQNEAHWKAYKGMPGPEKAQYQSLLAARLVQQTHQHGGKVPVAELYDVWRNTGRNESWALRMYFDKFAHKINLEEMGREFKYLEVMYLIEPDQDHWGLEYQKALEKMQWNYSRRVPKHKQKEFAEYTAWEHNFMLQNNAFPPYRATPRWAQKSAA